ncbi:hypothetical protein RDI58_016651 [Solanum bulbocastanum]|uniref:Yippee domain-containing protein n=1 Tax=Solanum bulbocastanum TaxID=147425 RepID=A0AAN8YDY5_SOLBU
MDSELTVNDLVIARFITRVVAALCIGSQFISELLFLHSTMVRCYSLEYQDVIPLYDSIHCCKCGNQVARVHDYIRMVWPRGSFNRLFNVLVPENENFHLGQFGITVVNANCIECGELIGWKIDLGANEENADQDGDPNEQNVDQDGDTTDGDVNEHAPNEQGSANLQNVDQDKDTNEENVGTIQYNFTNLLMHFICQNTNQGGGGGNEQNHDRDGGSNEQVHNEQDVGANEKNADQDGDSTDEDAEKTDRDGDATD